MVSVSSTQGQWPEDSSVSSPGPWMELAGELELAP